MNWQARDKYHLTSDPEGYTIAVYLRGSTVRNLVAWKDKTELACRNELTTKEQYDAAMAELKQICTEDAGK